MEVSSLSLFIFLDAELKNLLGFFAVAKTIKGRTRLQKMVFVLKKVGAPFKENFKLHFFGPYSLDLQCEVDELASLGMLEEKKEGNLCVYTLNKNLTRLNLEELKKPFLEYESIIETLKKADIKVLELLATFLFLIETDEEETAMRKLELIKPHISDKIEEAINLWKLLKEKYLRKK
jgi:uncharacterized protein YwgA